MITGSGHRLGERYVLEERLAVGGMGEVWRGRDEVLNRAVAVKILRLELAPDAAFQARFRAEARTAAALSHGGIAAVFDYGEAMRSAYLVMELVPGEPLSAMITRHGALGTDRTLTIVAQAAQALHAAHLHGVVHRDIKPANLMITPELRVKITDFGISRPRDHEPLTATGQVMGTAHYLAPELARGEVATPLSDVYALGVVAYECLAGWRPFEGENQVEVATAQLTQQPPPLPETVPLPVRQLVESAMAKDPAARPQGAHAFAAALEDLRLRRLAGQRPTVATARSGDGAAPAGGTTIDARARGGSAQGPSRRAGAVTPAVTPAASSAALAAAAAAGGTAVDQPAVPRPARLEASEDPARGRADARVRRSEAAAPAHGTRASRRGPATASLPEPSGPGGRGGGPAADAGRRRPPVTVLALGGLVVVAAVAAFMTSQRDDGDTSAADSRRPSATASAPAPDGNRPTPEDDGSGDGGSDDGAGGGVIADTSQLLGMDDKDARKWLKDKQVTYRIERGPSEEKKGVVIDVSPSGDVRLGEQVVVTISSGSRGEG